MCETTAMVMGGLRGDPIDPTPWLPTNDEIVVFQDFEVTRTFTFENRGLYDKLIMGEFPTPPTGKMFLWTRINGVQTFKWIDRGMPVSITCP